MLTFGIEEEFVFLDPVTLSPVHVAPRIRAELLDAGYATSEVQHELFQSQIEFASPVLDTREQAADALLGFRTALSAAAAEHGVVAAGTGTPYQKSPVPVMSEDNRYEEIAGVVAALSSEHEINGLHVHGGIPDPESGLRCLNGIRRWLPTLMAISANSPFWCGEDTGFASWRAIQSRRWTTAGCPPHFSNAEDYHERVNALIGIGGTPDSGSIAWYARLSQNSPPWKCGLRMHNCNRNLPSSWPSCAGAWSPHFCMRNLGRKPPRRANFLTLLSGMPRATAWAANWCIRCVRRWCRQPMPLTPCWTQ